ncbi:MAG: prepilin-type N-terminal cleavage/methylation domain-containing protein [Wujia sp.]|nr:prepilin-type N-terminal cleavage/methylation domain-containing protein [Wujia sp.]MDY3728180.1 prepilin-type N-terminal cleavage/methylation domain-containing protein [Wujia sp.]
MKKLKQLFQKFHNKNQGLTLVEMIVTFMLIGLFMIAASKVIANTMSVYYEAKGTANGMQVSSIIAAKIQSEIEGAKPEQIIREVTNADGTVSDQTEDYVIQLSSDSTLGGGNETGGYNKIEFTDAKGSHVYIGVNTDGYLVVHYFMDSADGTPEDKTDWMFDKKSYMGYTIKELKFRQPKGDYAENIIYMSLTLHSPRYGDFTYTEYIQCYNLDETAAKIDCQTE